MSETTHAFADVQLADALAALNRVRAIQRCAGTTQYDAPVTTDDRINFYIGYQEGLERGWKNWAAAGEWSGYYVIELTGLAEYDVFFLRMPERSNIRSESLKASFTRLEDATKFIMIKVLDSVRSNSGLESLFLTFRGRGLDDRLIRVAPDAAAQRKMIARLSPDKKELVEKHLQKFVLKDDPLTCSIGFPGVEPYMNSMPLTYGEVEIALVTGMSPTVLDCIRVA
jgi:hypothetical protein